MWHDRSRLKLEDNGQSRSLKRTVRQSHVISRLFENDLYWFVAKVWVVFGLSLTLVEDVEDVEEVASRKRASETIHITSGSSSSGGKGSRCGSNSGAEDLEEESAQQELGE